MAQPLVGYGTHDDMAEPRLLRVGSDTGCCLPEPLANAAIGIVVEAVHAVGTESAVLHIAVPAFPDGCRTVVDGVEPAGVLALEEQFVGDVGHAVIRQRLHQDRGAEESRLQTVAVVGEVLSESANHLVASLTLHEVVLQGEEGRCLHRVEHLGLEASVGGHERRLHVCPRLVGHPLVACSVAPRSAGHVAHHRGIDGPVGSTQIAPVVGSLAAGVGILEGQTRAALQRFIAQPVGPLVVAILSDERVVAILRLVDVLHEAVHRLPALVNDIGVGKLFPHRPGHDDAGIGPAEAHHVVR